MADLRTINMPEHLMAMTEFRLLDEAVDDLMSDIDDEIEALHNDLLITTATERGIARREKILGLRPDPSDSLEVRRARVLFWWYNRMPYTRKVIESRIKALCGDGNYTMEVDSDNEILHVGIQLDLGWNVINTVKDLLDDLVMLNFILDVRGVALETITAGFYVGIGMREIVYNAPMYDNR